MPRIAAAFIAVCMLLIAGSVGAALYLSGSLGPVEAAVVALAILITLVVYNASVSRVRDRSDTGGQIADLSRGIADLARQVGDIGRRLVAAEAAVATVGDKTRAATTPLSAEIAELSTLVKELAKSVAAHDTAIRATIPTPTPATESTRRPPDVARVETARDLAEFGAPDGERAAANRFKASEQSQLLGVVRAAIEANRVDLYLQPIVSLPQRKVRSYEATTRLRSEDGEVLQPSDFLDVAEASGMLPRVDNLILFRCVQVARRLATKNREVSIFCNISGTTLVDPEFFPQVSEFMQTNRALASSVVLQFSQNTLRGMGPIGIGEPRRARRARVSLLPRSCERHQDRATRARRSQLPLRQGCSAAAAQARCRRRRRHPPCGFLRLARSLRNRPHRRPHRQRRDGHRPPRL